VLAVASDKFGFGGQYLVQLNGYMAVHLTDSVSTYQSLSGIWFERNREYIVVGSGIYEKIRCQAASHGTDRSSLSTGTAMQCAVRQQTM